MQRRALLAALTALCATAAFAVGAAVFDDVVADADPPVEGDGGELTNGSGGPPARGAGRGPPIGDSGGDAGCLLCGLSARALVTGLVPAVDPLLLVAVAAALVVAAAVVGLRPGGERDAGDDGDATERAAAETGGESATAGGADAAVTNEVYRAWRAMADRVDVADPETTTPGEYARAAADAGLDGDAVERLTEIFSAVRYGGAPATSERERAARDTLDALEEDEP